MAPDGGDQGNALPLRAGPPAGAGKPLAEKLPMALEWLPGISPDDWLRLSPGRAGIPPGAQGPIAEKFRFSHGRPGTPPCKLIALADKLDRLLIKCSGDPEGGIPRLGLGLPLCPGVLPGPNKASRRVNHPKALQNWASRNHSRCLCTAA